MRPNRPFALLGSFVALIVFSGLIGLALGTEAYSKLAPLGYDEPRFHMVNAAQIRFSYRLPPGLTWNAAYDHLTRQGWVIRDYELLVWPDLVNDKRTAAVFLRFGWIPLGREWLLLRRDTIDPQRFAVEIIQCTPVALLVPCA